MNKSLPINADHTPLDLAAITDVLPGNWSRALEFSTGNGEETNYAIGYLERFPLVQMMIAPDADDEGRPAWRAVVHGAGNGIAVASRPHRTLVSLLMAMRKQLSGCMNLIENDARAFQHEWWAHPSADEYCQPPGEGEQWPDDLQREAFEHWFAAVATRRLLPLAARLTAVAISPKLFEGPPPPERLRLTSDAVFALAAEHDVEPIAVEEDDEEELDIDELNELVHGPRRSEKLPDPIKSSLLGLYVDCCEPFEDGRPINGTYEGSYMQAARLVMQYA